MVVVPEVLVNWPRPNQPVPLAVKLVVDAPPLMLKRPLVMVDEALEMKPLVNVARPVCVRVPRTESVPSDAVCAKRFVLDAVVEKSVVVVAPFCPMRNTDFEALFTASKRFPVPHVVNLLYGVVVPMPTLPAFVITICSVVPSPVPVQKPMFLYWVMILRLPASNAPNKVVLEVSQLAVGV